MVALLAPAGQQAVDADGIDDGARHDVRADLRAFFHNDDGNLRGALLERMAAARPAGPAPTITTSNSMLSRSTSLIPYLRLPAEPPAGSPLRLPGY
jgi:hypothetical protein